ncbi:MAG: hypothetical protein JJE49_04865 [Peptostreptococcaceae bacterium]|nr:hypothetical protein [Peptostreptococcaceae bacterium]
MEKDRAVDGKQSQTNKKWSQLKSGQKDWIAQQMKLEYAKFVEVENRLPNKDEKEALISIVYQLIGEKGIWIAYHDIKKRFL